MRWCLPMKQKSLKFFKLSNFIHVKGLPRPPHIYPHTPTQPEIYTDENNSKTSRGEYPVIRVALTSEPDQNDYSRAGGKLYFVLPNHKGAYYLPVEQGTLNEQ